MNKKVISFIGLGVLAYAIFVLLVVTFYEDSPENMGWEDRESFNKQYIGKLQLEEFTFEKAISELGSPDLTEAKVEDVRYQVLFYRTHHVKSDGITTLDECTALLFKNGLLTAIGSNAYDKFKQLN